eukprot:SAG31_NODE_168_length_21484_cov_21.524994_14_plen_195_part_00
MSTGCAVLAPGNNCVYSTTSLELSSRQSLADTTVLTFSHVDATGTVHGSIAVSAGAFVGGAFSPYDFGDGTSGTVTGTTFSAHAFSPTAGTFTGAMFTPFDFSNGFSQVLAITVDDQPTAQSFTLTAAMTDAADVVSFLNAAPLVGATAAVDGTGNIQLVSATSGAGSSVVVEATSGADAQLLFGPGSVANAGR